MGIHCIDIRPTKYRKVKKMETRLTCVLDSIVGRSDDAKTQKLGRIVGTSAMMIRKCDEAMAYLKKCISELDSEDEWYDDEKFDMEMSISAQEQLKRAYQSMIDIVEDAWD